MDRVGKLYAWLRRLGRNYLSPLPLTSYLLLLPLTSPTRFTCDTKYRTVQIMIDRIASMPDHPAPYKMTDWYEKAHHFDQYVFNLDLKGEYHALYLD